MKFFIIIAFFQSLVLFAKCPLAFFEIKGLIKDDEGELVNNAKIYIFIDNEQISTIASNKIDYCTSDNKGKFVCKVYYDTYSFWLPFFGDVCKRKPKMISILVIHENFVAKRLIFSMNDIKKQKEIEIRLMKKGKNIKI